MKAEEFLTNKGVLNVEWDTDECGEFTLTELLDEYADEVSRELAQKAWNSRIRYPFEEDFNNWLKEQEEKC